MNVWKTNVCVGRGRSRKEGQALLGVLLRVQMLRPCRRHGRRRPLSPRCNSNSSRKINGCELYRGLSLS
jgi:hypothetical protein